MLRAARGLLPCGRRPAAGAAALRALATEAPPMAPPAPPVAGGAMGKPAKAAAAAAPAADQGRSVYSELSKARLSTLVVSTAAAGYMMAGGAVDWLGLAALSSGTALAAASAATFNQLYERHSDALMKRTCRRPLPAGRVTPTQAAAWGVATAVGSTGVLLAGTNPLTAALGAANIALYAGVYTPLKVKTEWNTWVGSVVGAIPPLMGWAAATGSLAGPQPLLLGATLFFWQFPHFFALAWPLRKDYAAGGHKMVPCADPTGRRTANIILRHTLYMQPLPLLAAATGVTSGMFAVEGMAVHAYLLYLALQFRKKSSNANARRIFRASLWYLPVILGGMLFHKRNWKAAPEEDDPVPIGQAVECTKAALRKACVHEKIGAAKPEMCPVTVHSEVAATGAARGLCPVSSSSGGSGGSAGSSAGGSGSGSASSSD